MDRFYIIANKAKDKGLDVSHQIVDYLEEHGKSCQISQEELTNTRQYRYTDASAVPSDTEAILVVGGDGTMIQAARDLSECQIPLIGINLGNLGYLAEIEKHRIRSALDRLMADHYILEKRMMLEGVIQNTDGTRITDVALNDIVVGRSGALRLTDYRIYVNDEFLAVYSADGIIIATPTGSTAYSLSAGGPIISPEAELIAVTPICSHTLNARSIILSAKDTVTIELCKDRDGVSRERLVSYDGDNSRNVETGGVITIRQAKQRTTILRLDKISFLEVLRNKFS